MKRKNPIAKAVTRVRPQVIPDKRRKLLDVMDEQSRRAEHESLDYEYVQQEGRSPEGGA